MAAKKPKQSGSSLKQFSNHLVAALLIFLLITGLYSFLIESAQIKEEIPLSQVAADIISGQVRQITVRGDQLDIVFSDELTKRSKKEAESSFSETLAAYGITPQMLADVIIRVENESGFAFWFFNLLPIIIPLIVVLFFFWFLSRQVRSSGMQAFTFGQSKARIVDPGDKKQKITFKDVAGNEEAKEELKEIVDFLKNPKKFLDIGARIPKGVLLMGPAGSGKTLLARAVAGEAGVPFLYLSGSEFVELFVGVGASRVRSLFEMAKKSSPAIIFIDEIDAVGRHRGSGLGGGNDEREQTLNQILVEMDGFEPNEKIIVLSATNRPDVLDPALLRPGRFDRRVVIDLPDLKDREAILNVHAGSKKLAEDVDLTVTAERTPGFSGADLANLINEAAILAARENRSSVSQYDLIRSIEKVMLGPERKSHIFSEREKEIVAYHETGHALVASVLEYADPVHKVTIISRGRAGGYTLKLPLEERRLKSHNEFLDDIASLMGGYAAEKMVYGDITTGPSNDISVATAIARDMVMKYGMSEKVGPVSFDETTFSPYFGRGAFSEKNYSEEYAARIDGEVKSVMEEGFSRARTVLEKHKDALDAIAKKLKEVETLERKEFEEQLILHGIEPKRKKEGAILGGLV
ncbi:MAG: ATP-dependent zinc metalloprotease FtsH [Candidatus Vogelbacteria bacterium]|nr:ATP-dependent zinc metalloprotease FtsH [Candidatus Vogelbacteria bacterium]